MNNIKAVSVYCEPGEVSLLELLPSWITTYVKSIPVELFELSEADIKSKITQITPTIERLRIAFWMEHARAIQRSQPMQMTNVYGGLVGFGWFKSKFITNTFNLLYMLTPPTNYDVAIEETLMILTDQLRMIASLPPIDEEGKIDNKLVASKISLFKELSDRRRGKAISRMQIQQHTTTETISAEMDELSAKDVAEIEAEVRLLEDSINPPLLVSDEKEKEE